MDTDQFPTIRQPIHDHCTALARAESRPGRCHGLLWVSSRRSSRKSVSVSNGLRMSGASGGSSWPPGAGPLVYPDMNKTGRSGRVRRNSAASWVPDMPGMITSVSSASSWSGSSVQSFSACCGSAVDVPVPPDEAVAAVDHNPLTRSRRRGGRHGWHRRAVSAAAAVAAAIVAVVATLAITLRSRPVDVLASAPLAAYGQTPPTAHGNAQVLAGERMRIRVADLPDVPGYYEVWLIDPATMQMFSVGVLAPGTSNAVMALPANLDLTRYRVVDVSAEQYDNNPAHSGDSLLRGELP